LIKVLQRSGNSKAVILSKWQLQQAKINKYINITVEGNKIVITAALKEDIETFNKLTKGG
jgi:antitoxin component of MazEF toxin-antitoxin module